MALNISAIYLGTALGGAMGGMALVRFTTLGVPLAAAGLVILATAVFSASAVAARKLPATSPVDTDGNQ